MLEWMERSSRGVLNRRCPNPQMGALQKGDARRRRGEARDRKIAPGSIPKVLFGETVRKSFL